MSPRRGNLNGSTVWFKFLSWTEAFFDMSGIHSGQVTPAASTASAGHSGTAVLPLGCLFVRHPPRRKANSCFAFSSSGLEVRDWALGGRGLLKTKILLLLVSFFDGEERTDSQQIPLPARSLF